MHTCSSEAEAILCKQLTKAKWEKKLQLGNAVALTNSTGEPIADNDGGTDSSAIVTEHNDES